MDKRTSFRINSRTETTFGITSILFGGVSLILFALAVYQAAYFNEGRELIIGIIELVAMLFCLSGLLFGIVGEFRPDKFHKTAHAGIALNIIVAILHIIVLVQGF